MVCKLLELECQLLNLSSFDETRHYLHHYCLLRIYRQILQWAFLLLLSHLISSLISQFCWLSSPDACWVARCLFLWWEREFICLFAFDCNFCRLTMVCGWYNWIYCNLYLVLLCWLDIKCITRSNILTSRFLYCLLKLTLFC